jgi:hypothetical protein
VKIIITAELDEDSDTADPDESTGLTAEAHDQLWSFMSRLGFDDVEIQAHDD